MRKPPVLYIIVPCYNEAGVLPETNTRLRRLLNALVSDNLADSMSRITYVDDGSKDTTWNIIAELTDSYECCEGIKLTRNAGHQNALWAGMMQVRDRADAVVTIDADLQDDVCAIREFVAAYMDGNEIVFGVRKARKADTWFKRNSAQGFYRFMNIMGVDVVYNHADYRLLSKRALDALSEFSEVNLFLRGMVPLLGFDTKTVYYERGERFAGESKYPLRKMLSFALEGITSFSIKPIRFVVMLGALLVLFAAAMLIYVLVSKFLGTSVAGWPSLMVSIWMIGGINLMAVGLIGEYVGKIYMEVKHRPKYILGEYKKHKSMGE